MPERGIRLRITSTPLGSFETDNKSSKKVFTSVARELARDVKSVVRSAGGGGRTTFNSGGNKYKPYLRGRHQASSPGNAPATQTGFLSNRLHGIAYKSGQGLAVKSGAYYSAALERGANGPGSRRIEPRPYLQSTVERKWPSVLPRIIAALRDGIKYKATRRPK